MRELTLIINENSIQFKVSDNSPIFMKCKFPYSGRLHQHNLSCPLKDPRRGPSTRPRGSNFFYFHAVFRKKLTKNSFSRPHPREILDPPLMSQCIVSKTFFLTSFFAVICVDITLETIFERKNAFL